MILAAAAALLRRRPRVLVVGLPRLTRASVAALLRQKGEQQVVETEAVETAGIVIAEWGPHAIVAVEVDGAPLDATILELTRGLPSVLVTSRPTLVEAPAPAWLAAVVGLDADPADLFEAVRQACAAPKRPSRGRARKKAK
jgi:hypothetical protein